MTAFRTISLPNWIIAVKATFCFIKPSSNHRYQVIGSIKCQRRNHCLDKPNQTQRSSENLIDFQTTFGMDGKINQGDGLRSVKNFYFLSSGGSEQRSVNTILQSFDPVSLQLFRASGSASPTSPAPEVR